MSYSKPKVTSCTHEQSTGCVAAQVLQSGMELRLDTGAISEASLTDFWSTALEQASNLRLVLAGSGTHAPVGTFPGGLEAHLS